jgi:hypothetical protein
VQHYLSAIFYFYVKGVARGVESFFVDFANVGKRNAEMQKIFVVEGFDAHVVESFSVVAGAERQKTIFGYSDHADYYGKNVDEETR